METQLFQILGGTVTNVTNAFVIPASSGLISNLRPVANIGVIIYFAITGLFMVLGGITAPALRLLVIGTKIVLIAGFALNSGTYTTYIINGFTGLQEGLIVSLGIADGGSMYAVLDDTLAKGVSIVKQCIDKADDSGWFSIGTVVLWLITAGVVAGGVGLVCLAGFAAIVLSKLALAIMFGVGPFFVMLAMFPTTARFFEGWFSQVMNYLLLGVIASVIMSFAVLAIGSFLDASVTVTDGDKLSAVMTAVEAFITSAFLIFLLQQAAGMSAGLAGGLSMAAITLAHMARATDFVQNILNPQSRRRDIKSGMITQASRAEHIGSGNTWMNPHYAQGRMNDFGSNWGKWQGGKAKNKSKPAMK